ncbi:AsmA-like C-terminal region-containing protein [Flavicella sediminum]|uniref:AsmA-like C-terminal region-containing protein n=1 Tax=Flavicella sediminum TaxID=2585141 RepID=UPI00111DEBAE|nr:AsmA-like C-terminal region-containing protein [Flavicella sediminum]
MKKAIKIITIVFLSIIVLLITIPFLFKSQIEEIITKEIKNTLTADVSFDSFSISLLKNFPSATIILSDFSIVPKAPFDETPLFSSETILLETNLSDLISQQPKVKNISISNAQIAILTNKEGAVNYNIVKDTGATVEETSNESSNFSLEIENYSLSNIDFLYKDDSSDMSVVLKNLNHTGTGKYIDNSMLLNTNSTLESFTFSMGEIPYLNKVTINWNAVLAIDLNSLKVDFKENLAHLNDLNISFDGFIQPNDAGILMDLKIAAKESQFKSLLSLVPSAYASNFKDVKASGGLNLEGRIHGQYAETEIPKFDIHIDSKNASFQYPDLPKSVSNITIITSIINTTGKEEDIKVNIKDFGFQIDKDVFKASSIITNLTSNPTVTAKLEGVVNLDNLSKAYPVALEQELHGTISAQLQTAFNMEAIDKNKYQEIKNSGVIRIKNFTTKTELLPHEIAIATSELVFDSKSFKLTKFEAKTGDSDLSINGRIDNLYGYIFSDNDLKGNFNLSSKKLKISDLLTAADTTTVASQKDSLQIATTSEAIKIPAKIDAVINVKAQEVLYDNLVLSQLTGVLKIKDQKAIFENTKANMLGGTIAITGKVDTQPTPSNFDFKLNIKDFDIANSFTSLDLLASMAPFANSIDGKMSTNFNLSGALDNDFFPDTKSLKGDALANLDVTKVDASKSKAMSLMESKLSFIDFSKLDVKKVAAKLNFAEQKVIFTPFKIATYDGMPITLGGSHSFENQMDYKVTMDLPAKYLGSEVSGLLSSLSATDQNTMKVPFTIHIGGAVSKPSVQPDLKSATSALSQKIVSTQKTKLVDKLLGKTSKEKDSTKNSSSDLKDKAKNLLKGLF